MMLAFLHLTHNPEEEIWGRAYRQLPNVGAMDCCKNLKSFLCNLKLRVNEKLSKRRFTDAVLRTIRCSEKSSKGRAGILLPHLNIGDVSHDKGDVYYDKCDVSHDKGDVSHDKGDDDYDKGDADGDDGHVDDSSTNVDDDNGEVDGDND